MQEKNIKISYKYYSNYNELDLQYINLINKAEESLERAYSIYSGFSVGAALLLDNGQIITGNNQENSAYPSAMCAERVALYYCKAQYPNAKVLKIVIAAKSIHTIVDEPASPCGGCRQVMIEYEKLQKSKIEVVLKGDSSKLLIFSSVSDLLPFSFDSTLLRQV